MELRQLRYVVTLAEELHFGRAAARHYITHGALSQQIARLERELGCRLFERTSRHVQLTEAGALFLEHARSTLNEADAAVAAVRAHTEHRRHRFTVGLHDEGLAELTGPVLNELRRRLPSVHVTTRAMRYDELPDALHDGQVDVIFGSQSVAAVRSDTFVDAYDDAMVLLVSQTSDYADAEELQVTDVLDGLFPTAQGVPAAFAAPYHLCEHRNGDAPRLVEVHGATWFDLLSTIAYDGAIMATNADSMRLLPTAGTVCVPLRDVAPISLGAILPPTEIQVHAVLRDVLSDIAGGRSGEDGRRPDRGRRDGPVDRSGDRRADRPDGVAGGAL